MLFWIASAFRVAFSNALADNHILRILLKRNVELNAVDLVRFASESSTIVGSHPELIVGYLPPVAGTLILIQ